MDSQIINRLWIEGDATKVGNLRQEIQGNDEINEEKHIDIDFNKIIPMPDSLDVEDNENAAMAAAYSLREFETENPAFQKHPMDLNTDDFKLYLTYLKNAYNYKYVNWAHWRIANWNSAWNAYDTKSTDEYIQFKTRNSPSLNVTLELSRRHKDLKFIHGWAECESGMPGKFILQAGIAMPWGFDNEVELVEFSNNLLEEK